MIRESFTHVGLSCLEAAVIDVLHGRSGGLKPWQIADRLGIYPGLRLNGQHRAGSYMVRAVLAKLERTGKVERSRGWNPIWRLKEK